MNQKTKYIVMLTILPLVMVAFVDCIAEAAAQPAEGSAGQVSPKSYGSATDDIVCGDRLCSTPEGSTDPVNVGRAQ